MKNIALILLLLLGTGGVARLVGVSPNGAGRLGLAAVFAFTALGHFLKREQMAAMIPSALPFRAALVFGSGVFEAALSVFLLVPEYSRQAGVVAGVFLFLVTPLNVYAAFKRVDFGGHSAGPAYLFVRLPLQAFLVFWAYWFAVRAN